MAFWVWQLHDKSNFHNFFHSSKKLALISGSCQHHSILSTLTCIHKHLQGLAEKKYLYLDGWHLNKKNAKHTCDEKATESGSLLLVLYSHIVLRSTFSTSALFSVPTLNWLLTGFQQQHQVAFLPTNMYDCFSLSSITQWTEHSVTHVNYPFTRKWMLW